MICSKITQAYTQMIIQFKPKLSFWQIINMNFGFFGIQYSFGLQQTAMNPIYTFLNANPEDLPILNLAGPMTGLLIQPVIGAISDKTWSPRWGRRKPYFLVGAIFCSLCLFSMPFSSTLWMAASLLWILDAANNTAMEPYRAFIADKLPEEQQPTGFLAQSFFTGLGITLANLSLYFFQIIITGKSPAGIPYWAFGSFFVGCIASIGSVLWSVKTTPEIPPSEEELEEMAKRKGKGIFEPFIEIFSAIREMPTLLKKLALVYLFQWYAMFCYWQFISHGVAKSVWGIEANLNNLNEQEKHMYEEAVGWTGLLNGWYNIVTFLSAFGLVWLAQKYSAKWVHFICLLMAGIALLILPGITNKYLLFIPMVGFGIAWASMMGVPYILVAASIPKTRYGVYMGIVNMMIVVPMLIQNLSFGYIYKTFLDSNPLNAIRTAGVLLCFAATAMLFIKSVKASGERAVFSGGGH